MGHGTLLLVVDTLRFSNSGAGDPILARMVFLGVVLLLVLMGFGMLGIFCPDIFSGVAETKAAVRSAKKPKKHNKKSNKVTRNFPLIIKHVYAKTDAERSSFFQELLIRLDFPANASKAIDLLMFLRRVLLVRSKVTTNPVAL